MAEFALGLTKTAVEGTLSRVRSAIEDERKLKVQVQNDLVFITGEFEMMQSFLNVANAAERAQNQVVRTWVRQLCDLAFDVEDCVEFVINLDKTSAMTSWFWRVLPSCIASELPLDMAISEIHQLKARVMDVSDRNTRYNLIGTNSDSNTTSKLLSSPAPELMPLATAHTSTSSSPFRILCEVWAAAGKLSDTCNLTKLITSEGNDLQVVSLWQGDCSTEAGGTGHRGATLSYNMKKLYDDPMIRHEFKIRAWVKLMHPFHPDEFVDSLLTQLYITSSHHQPNTTLVSSGHADFRMKKMEAAVAKKLMQQLNEQRYFIILEDVSTVVEWDAIRMYLPDSHNGSRIVVSTQHLSIALLCTGDPYQVSQLTPFSHGQPLCAFSNKGPTCRRDMGELNWQIRCRGVISVVGHRHLTPANLIIPRLYKCIMHKRKNLDGVVFQEHSWVDVPDPFNIESFCIRLYLNFQPGDFHANEIAAAGRMGHQSIVQRCSRYLREDDCLIVINGLQSTEHWEIIKVTLLSGEPTKGCSIIVITYEASVATYCVLDQLNRVFRIDDVQADEVLCRLIKDSECMEDSHNRRSQLFYNLMDEIVFWTRKFKLDGREKEVSALTKRLENTNPGVISVWGRPGVGKSALVRSIYYRIMHQHLCGKLSSSEHDMGYTAFSLVDVPDPFDDNDFAWRLLLDFHSSGLISKGQAAFGMMKGQSAIQACCEFLRLRKCLVVIDGLQLSYHWWTVIKTTFLSKSIGSSCIIVITNEEDVAKCCVDNEEDRALKVKRQKPIVAFPPSFKGPRRSNFSYLLGRREELKCLKASYSIGVTSLWGIAGVGKSGLVRNLYNKHQNFFGGHTRTKKSWVDVSHPFHLTEFSWQLLLGFHSNDLQAKERAAVDIMEGQDIIQACCQFLRQDQCLIVIDGLRSSYDWDMIKGAFLSEPTYESNARFIVITTEASVATHCASDKYRVHNIKSLDSENAHRLFKEIVWGRKRLAPYEMKFSKVTMAKCGGLPRVIAAIGDYSSQKEVFAGVTEMSIAMISREIHDDFMGKLEMSPNFHNLKGLFSWMQTYFDACPDSLKPCIFYLSIFPMDYNFRRKRVVRRWIAEGYSRDKLGSTVEEDSEMLFSELVKLSIIQDSPSKWEDCRTRRIKVSNVCQVNGFFREYIISRPMEDNLVFALEGNCSRTSQRAGQHLAIRSSWDRDKTIFESMDLSRLRSVTVFGEWRSFFISTVAHSSNMRLLRVLDLEDTTSGVTDDVLEQIGKLLPRLKFLSLRRCNDITRLPDSFGGLRQLQTLDVRQTKIVMLPRAIMQLVKLQYIRAGTTREQSVEEDEQACTSSSSSSSSSSEEEGEEEEEEENEDDYDYDDDDDDNADDDDVQEEEEEEEEEDDDDDDDDEGRTSISTKDGNGVVTSIRFPPVNIDCSSTSQPKEVATVEDGDGSSISQPEVATEIDCSSTRQSPTAQEVTADDCDVSSTRQPAAAANDGVGSGTSKPSMAPDSDDSSRSQSPPGREIAVGDFHVSGKRQPPSAAGAAAARNDGDGSNASQLTVAPDTGGSSTSQPPPKAASDSDGTSTSLTVVNEDRASTRLAPLRSKAQDLVSWLSKKKKLYGRRRLHNDSDSGVEIPAAGLRKLTALHTLGVVNVTSSGYAILKELKNITQLRKLGVSGINRKNWHDLCLAISDHAHLESLSVQFSDKQKQQKQHDRYCLGDISNPPKTLMSLKLYGGNVHVSPAWMKQLKDLTKAHLKDVELIISTQEDIDSLVAVRCQNMFRHLCLKPIQHGQLHYGRSEGDCYGPQFTAPHVLKIDCSIYRVNLVFGDFIPGYVEVLVFQCSTTTGFSLEVSGLEKLYSLKEVRLEGSYSDAVKQHLQQIVASHPKKPVLRLEEQPSSS